MRSAYPWLGGKFYEKDFIVPKMPKCKYYHEAFFGSGVLLLNRPKVEEEFANDLFSCLVSFWETLKEARLTRRLWREMNRTLDSRYIYKEYMTADPEALNIVDRAYRFLYLIKFGFNSFMDTYYTPLTHSFGKIKDFMQTWLNTAKMLFDYHERIKKVHFSNLDFRIFLKGIKPDSRKFIFLDPPYIDTHSYSKGYYKEGKFEVKFYDEMRDLLEVQTEGGTKWMITCNQKNEVFDSMKNVIIDFVDRRACINKNEERVTVKTKVVMNYDVYETGSCLDDIEEKKEGDFLLI